MLFKILLQIVFVGGVFSWEHTPSAELTTILEGSTSEALVAFLAPWTEASKSLEPEWLNAAAKSSRPMHSIDCTTELSFCKDQNIISYPTIRLVSQRKAGISTIHRYRGPRKSAAILAYLKRTHRGPATLDAQDIAEFKTKDEIVFIAYNDPGNEVLDYNFNILATRHWDRFAFSVAEQALAKNEGVAPGCVVRYMKNEEPQSICGEWKLNTLQRFMEMAAAPIVGEINRRNELNYLTSGKSLLYFFAETKEERDDFKSTLKALARQYAEYLSLVTVDAVEYAGMAPALGLRPGVFPALAVQNPSAGQVFPFEQGKKITAQIVETFVLDIVEGRVKPGPRSQQQETGHTEL